MKGEDEKMRLFVSQVIVALVTTVTSAAASTLQPGVTYYADYDFSDLVLAQPSSFEIVTDFGVPTIERLVIQLGSTDEFGTDMTLQFDADATVGSGQLGDDAGVVSYIGSNSPSEFAGFVAGMSSPSFTGTVSILVSGGTLDVTNFTLWGLSPAQVETPFFSGIANKRITTDLTNVRTELTAVPAPAGFVLMLIGIGSLALLRRRTSF